MIKTIQTERQDVYPGFITDTFLTESNIELNITFIKHASMILDFAGVKIFVDPVSTYADFNQFPKADVILITHEHYDHLDAKAISEISKPETVIVANKNSCKILKKGHIIMNGEQFEYNSDIQILAVPAYNITPAHLMFHPRYRDNGYVLTLGNSKIYISGDTENIPELKQLNDIDIAFISVNQPYTMTIAEAIDAAKAIHPAILYPYHLTTTNDEELMKQLQKSGIKVIRDRMMQ